VAPARTDYGGVVTIAGFRREGSMMGGISLGGILVIVGIVLLILGYTILGIIIALIGLLAFGGFARGRWY
jgi:hypothetical protein